MATIIDNNDGNDQETGHVTAAQEGPTEVGGRAALVHPDNANNR